MSDISKKNIITRFAPSPTGHLHIGSARTALFSWLYGKSNFGKIILRIEDTDKERSKDEFTDSILKSLEWLKLNFDDEPIIQSSRIFRHQEVANFLVKNDKAYYCYSTKDEIDDFHKNYSNQKFISPWATNTSTNKIPNNKPTIRIRSSAIKEGNISFYDALRGDVSISTDELDDMIILRSDGTPTYMFAVVVDDNDYNVNFIVRGEDHITNTFRQIQIYKALNWNIPKYAHIPLINDVNGKKLSKRHHVVSVIDFKKKGYLPEAILNYLMRLGWALDGDSEIISVQDAIKNFKIEDVSKSQAKFDIDKLNYLNSFYIQKSKIFELFMSVIDMMQENDINKYDLSYYKSLLNICLDDNIISRFSTLEELVYFNRDYIFNEKIQNTKINHIDKILDHQFFTEIKFITNKHYHDFLKIEKTIVEILSEIGIDNDEKNLLKYIPIETREFLNEKLDKLKKNYQNLLEEIKKDIAEVQKEKNFNKKEFMSSLRAIFTPKEISGPSIFSIILLNGYKLCLK